MSLVHLSPDQRQLMASDPRRSVWVSASAGTGKTKVLSDRVLRLLLAGVEPSRILCLTYTKAAAAEMKNRIFRRLAEWAIANRSELRQSLCRLHDDPAQVDDTTCERAMRLFGEIVDLPDGMRIQTIHAFCQSLLSRFPIEAKLPPHFQVVDDLTAKELIRDARHRLLEASYESGEERFSGLREAFDALADIMGEGTLQKLLDAIIGLRGRLSRWFDGDAGREGMIRALYERFGFDPDASMEELVRSFHAECDRETLQRIVPLFQSAKAGGAKDAAACFESWSICNDPAAGMWEAYSLIFLKADGKARKKVSYTDVDKQHDWVEPWLRQEQARVICFHDRLLALNNIRQTAQLMTVADGLLALYESLKAQRGYLDYDDLVQHTLALLEQEGIAPWILYRLDGGIDHILIDEAQDTGPELWRIISLICEEFFSGEGLKEGQAVPPSLFVVGDDKQSIYRFQGADPEEFIRMRGVLGQRITDAAHPFSPVPLQHSFRSTAPVLDLVDAVFAAGQPAAMGVTLPDQEIRHLLTREGMAGRVELWPLVPRQEKEGLDPWPVPEGDRMIRRSAEQMLADRVADSIADWLASRRLLPSKGRPVRPGDILILMRSRNALVQEITRALHQRHIPVSGADRLKLIDHIAVQDLLALAEWLLLPEDNLTLACLLKSPLIGMSEEALFALAWNREGKSLWQCLREHGQEPDYAAAVELLSSLLRQADMVSPFDLFSTVLDKQDGRRRFAARLGSEINELFDEFLSLAIEYEQGHPASLQGFLQWIAAGGSEVKRDMEAAHDEVRIMTVHSAKGLQAPIVFLPHTTHKPEKQKQERIVFFADGDASAPALPLWYGNREQACAEGLKVLRRLDEAEKAEYHRLLYVALTRAEDELYLCGIEPRGGRASEEDDASEEIKTEPCWYDHLEAAMRTLGTAFERRFPDCDEPASCLMMASAQVQAVASSQARIEQASEPVSLPDFLHRPVPAEPQAASPLMPSHMMEGPAISPLPVETVAMRRGTAIHRLMQYLPDLPSSGWEEMAKRYLAVQVPQMEAAAHETCIREVLSLLRHPDYRWLFGETALAEVPVTGRVGDAVVSGQIDRLAVQGDTVWIADFKTGRDVPSGSDKVPAAYLKQMSLYAALLGRIYESKKVRACLIYTAGPALIEIPQEKLRFHGTAALDAA